MNDQQPHDTKQQQPPPRLSDVPIETIIEAVEGYAPHITGRR